MTLELASGEAGAVTKTHEIFVSEVNQPYTPASLGEGAISQA